MVDSIRRRTEPARPPGAHRGMQWRTAFAGQNRQSRELSGSRASYPSTLQFQLDFLLKEYKFCILEFYI